MDSKINPIRYGTVAAAVLCFINLAAGQAADKKTLNLQGAARVIAVPNALENSATSSEVPAVSYFEKSKVDAAFAKGAVLFDGSDGRNYMVHASRREQPGQAEVHAKDSDIIYVLHGTATFITGGKAVDGKTIAPDEIRATSINGGEPRKISEGDVIIVPHGVPHQFVEVTNPFLYFVVKVR
jgi:quercetin dioxygenase-like cupin family protein